MPHMQHYTEAERRLGHLPVNADDIVVMVSDVLYDYLPPEGSCGGEIELRRVNRHQCQRSTSRGLRRCISRS